MAGDASLVLVGGRILTSSKERPWAKALAVRGDRLLAVGTDAQAERWSGRGTRTVDLRGRVVVPGFIDAHTHIASASRRIGWTDLSKARSLEEAVAALRAILRRGIPLAFGSDGMPYGPLNGIHWAVNGPFEDERLAVEEAVRAYTAGGAYAGFEEDAKGTLEAGKLADFVILDGDPFESPETIRDLRVHSTWIGGQPMYQAAKSRGNRG